MPQLQLRLTLNEINQILGALGTRPYAEVVDLISKISEQARSQLPEGAQPAGDGEAAGDES